MLCEAHIQERHRPHGPRIAMPMIASRARSLPHFVFVTALTVFPLSWFFPNESAAQEWADSILGTAFGKQFVDAIEKCPDVPSGALSRLGLPVRDSNGNIIGYEPRATGWENALRELPANSACLSGALADQMARADALNLVTEGITPFQTDLNVLVFSTLAGSANGRKLLMAARETSPHAANRALADLLLVLGDPAAAPPGSAISEGTPPEPTVVMVRAFAAALRGDAEAVRAVLRFHFDDFTGSNKFEPGPRSPYRLVIGYWPSIDLFGTRFKHEALTNGIQGMHIVRLTRERHPEIDSLLRKAKKSRNSLEARNAAMSLQAQ